MKIQNPLYLEYNQYIEEQKNLNYHNNDILTKEQFRNIFHLPKWKFGDILQEDEYVLKIKGKKGFLTKLKKDGSLLKTFHDWEKSYPYTNIKLSI